MMQISKLIKREIIITVSAIIFMILGFIGLSYAIFMDVDETPENVIKFGDVALTYCKDTSCDNTINNIGKVIGVNNGVPSPMYPQTKDQALLTVPYIFKLQNTGSLDLNIDIYLQKDATFTPSGDYSSYAPADDTNIMYAIGEVGQAPIISAYSDRSGDNVLTLTMKPGVSKVFNLWTWLKENAPNSAQGTYFVADIQVKAEYKPDGFLDTSKANEPLLADGMIPVIYDEETNVWKKTSTLQSKWYSYDEQKWANAVTVSSGTYAEGDAVPMDNILGMWVWIPRYEYMTTSLGTQYASGTQSEPGEVSIKFISGLNTTNTPNYLLHPAFRNGTIYKKSVDYDLGGWDKELTGIWIGKFETSGTVSSPTIKPNSIALSNQNINTMFNTSATVQTYQHIGPSLVSHMTKNDQWAALTYLKQSKYGKRGNTSFTGANKEVYVNNSTSFYTGRSNGIPGGTSGNASANGTYSYNGFTCIDTSCLSGNKNVIAGVGASTTGNIYGVYDTSGGVEEYLMGNYNNTISSSGFGAIPAPKYYNKYTTTNINDACNGGTCPGHALSETSSYYFDNTNFIDSASPWLVRGGNANNASAITTGLFGYDKYNGSAHNNYGFRVSLS
ncbi:MAG: hypothetical protein RR228_01030 [Bacilli bacterium]